MTQSVQRGLFRLRLPDRSERLARGPVQTGPVQLLAPELTLDELVGAEGPRLLEAVTDLPGAGVVPVGSQTLVPLERQEVWAAGVTYARSRDARMEETLDGADCYARVYRAERPELFFKATAERVRPHGAPIGIRDDSSWDVPEPELALVLSPTMEVVGYTIGNDVSSRGIEGENPLYLPQAKVYDGSCSIGPALVPAELTGHPFEIVLELWRAGTREFSDSTSTAQLRRSERELCDHLGRCLSFPYGACLLTGTSIVPPASFTLAAGDEVVVRISDLGELRNPVEVVPARDRAGVS